jgi:hypothetical protein
MAKSFPKFGLSRHFRPVFEPFGKFFECPVRFSSADCNSKASRAFEMSAKFAARRPAAFRLAVDDRFFAEIFFQKSIKFFNSTFAIRRD